ncbi:VOC family protein [Methylobacterium oxalidis]|uniref:glyoxalase n=1 Tax=Methylobacterium oxalidis TaxID=944322 RepID=UPI003315B910
MLDSSPFRGYHHVTTCVGGAQADYDFHVKFLGLRCVKRTVLLDGEDPIYHLYYGNGDGAEGTIVTTFPMAHRPLGERGSGQVRTVSLAVPVGSLPFWRDRLERAGYAASPSERFGLLRLGFEHPAGISYELVGVARDSRTPWTGADVPAAAAIRGIYGVTVAAADVGSALRDYLRQVLRFGGEERDGQAYRFTVDGGAVGDDPSGRTLEVVEDRVRSQGTWGYRPGTVHHVALHIPDRPTQDRFKRHVEALGFNDISEPKDRNYFQSLYWRTPAGALFEGAVTQEKGWLKDESPDELGRGLQLPERLIDRRDAIVARLEPIIG